MQTIAVDKCVKSPAAILEMVECQAEEWGQIAVENGYYKPIGHRGAVALDRPFQEYETQTLAWEVIRD
ncbi:hypothetical protein AOC05_04835 [Arthrobacter alpinus]|uniref:Uncharacterized protein n=2 Tax=Arthrobacter TaxID=1663 RepID=A0A0M5LX47_9MICC|nr:hypothetical protein AOC05_04835 [Arthrobacter alpinus]